MGKDLEITGEERNVGVIRDDKLNFEAHISKKINKANSLQAIIRRTFNYLDKKKPFLFL